MLAHPVFKSKFFTGLFTVVLIFLGLAFVRSRQPIQNLDAEIHHLNQKLIEAQRKNDELQQAVDNSQNEAYIERQLRLKLNYKKPDEEVVLIYKTEPTVQQSKEEGFLMARYHTFSNWIKNLFNLI